MTIEKLKIRSTLVGMTMSVAISVLGLTTTATAQMKDVAKSQQLPTKNEMIVAYYGRPGVKSLGVLGQHSLESIIPIIKAKANEYKKASGNQNVVPGFDIIYGLAAADPGRKKDYVIPLSSKKLMPYINAANKHGFAVFIDLQLGKMTPVQAIQPVLEYLKYDNVHLAIDPEFEVYGLNVRPGKVIGSITGKEINQVQAAMTDYLSKNGIKEKKILIVHMFRHTMVTNKNDLKKYDKIDLVFNLDGHGSPKLKVDIYNNIYTKRTSNEVAGGFKLFFDEDKPRLMTPKQVLGLESASGVKIKEVPKYINYQ
ncbi:MAG: hypothetical protein U9Q90_01085 [Campylobacterota bacterium]|nr:hypothetical protein [Campylobacterota bacterium]